MPGYLKQAGMKHFLLESKQTLLGVIASIEACMQEATCFVGASMKGSHCLVQAGMQEALALYFM